MTADFKLCVKKQLEWHPSMEPQDMYKLCYQVTYGAEHLIQDTESAWKYLQMEYEQVKAGQKWPVLEWLSLDVARVNLASYKALGLPLRPLFDVFVQGASQFSGNKETLEIYIGLVAEMARKGEICFDEQAWVAFCRERQPGPVHHSQNYKQKEQPAYRVISGQSAKRFEEYLGLDRNFS